MKVAKGVDGIRKHRTSDKVGWHIIIDGKYHRFANVALSQIFAEYSDSFTLVAITGNTLALTTEV